MKTWCFENAIESVSGLQSFQRSRFERYLLELEKLPNKVVVITGGNRGIGLHVVAKLLRCDMTVVMGEN